jgi:tetratricopeptide (TPR) repeat protein
MVWKKMRGIHPGRRSVMKKWVVLAILAAMMAATTVWSQEGTGPMTEKEVVKLIKKNKKDQMKAAGIVGQRSVSFEVTDEFKAELAKAGASEMFYRAVLAASPSGRSFTTPLGDKLQVSPEEKADFLQIQSEMDSAQQLKLCEDFEKKYPQSVLLSYVLSQLASIYQKQGQYDKVVELCNRSIQLEPKNIFSLVMVSMLLPQPRLLRGTPADNEKQVVRAAEHASKALDLMAQIPAEMLEKDEELQKRKASLSSDAHSALGMVALYREDPPTAADEFKAAIAGGSGANPTNYFRLGEAYETMGKLDQALEAFQNAADLGTGTPFQDFANRKIAEIKARKGLVTR